MKKILALILTAAMCMSIMTASAWADEAEYPITVEHAAGETEVEEIPERIFVLDMAALDIIDALGLGDLVVGVMEQQSKGNSGTPAYLEDYFNNEDIVVLSNGNMNGGHGMEAEEAEEDEDEDDEYDIYYTIDADLIIGGSNQSEIYDVLSDVAPTVIINSIQTFGSDETAEVYEAVKENLSIICQIFGLDAEAEEMIADFDGRVDALREKVDGTSGILTQINYKSNALKLSTNSAQFLTELGFENLALNAPESYISNKKGGSKGMSTEDTATGESSKDEASEGQGERSAKDEASEGQNEMTAMNSTSEEEIHANQQADTAEVTAWMEEQNPDYIFIVGSDYTSVEEAIEADVDMAGVTDLTAYQNGRVYFLSSSWSSALGGLTSFSNMLAELEAIF